MPEQDKTLAVPPKPISEYVPSIKVVTEDGTQVVVPVNSEANRLQSQVVAAELRDFMAKQVHMHAKTKTKMLPRELKDLVDTWAKVEENARFAYAPALTPDELGENGTTPAQMVKAMAEGMATAQIKTGRMERVLELGKTKQAAPVIDIKTGS